MISNLYLDFNSLACFARFSGNADADGDSSTDVFKSAATTFIAVFPSWI